VLLCVLLCALLKLFLLIITKGRCEWESDSGRQLTLQEVNASELSKVEMQALHRLAVSQLQSMDIPVSHGLIKGMMLCTWCVLV